MEPLFQLSISISLKSYSKKYFSEKVSRNFVGIIYVYMNSVRSMLGGKNSRMYSWEKGAKVFGAALMHIRLKYKRRSRLKDNTLNIPGKVFYPRFFFLLCTGNR